MFSVGSVCMYVHDNNVTVLMNLSFAISFVAMHFTLRYQLTASYLSKFVDVGVEFMALIVVNPLGFLID